MEVFLSLVIEVNSRMPKAVALGENREHGPLIV
jgi:hypothetical protein